MNGAPMKAWLCRIDWSWLIAPPLALEIMGDRLLQSNIKLAAKRLRNGAQAFEPVLRALEAPA